MIPEKLGRSDLADLGAVLRDAGYDSEGLARLFGSTRLPAAGELPRRLSATAEPTALNALARLYFLGSSLPEDDVRRVLPALFVDMALATGLLDAAEDGRLRGGVFIAAIEDLLFLSDPFRMLGTDEASGFVLPANTHSALFLKRLTLRNTVGSMLDLGCGSGVHALFAARHTKRVTATDISDRALRYTQANAILNGIANVDCLQGDRYEPVEGRRFDLIVSNPPFVIGPGSDFVYRDNPLELDGFLADLLGRTPAFLSGGGHAQVLGEWVEIDGQPMRERLHGWLSKTGCDAWILRSPPRKPAAYVEQRLADVSAGGSAPGRTGFSEWLAHLDERRVRAIHPGLVVLRRRDGDNWIRIFGVDAELREDTGQAVERSIAASDFAELCSDDRTLAEATLAISPAVGLEQHYRRDGADWVPAKALLRRTDGLPMDTEVDVPVMAFLNLLDGRHTLGECIEEFARLTGADAGRLATELYPAVRLFIANGFLEPAEPDAPVT